MGCVPKQSRLDTEATQERGAQASGVLEGHIPNSQMAVTLDQIPGEPKLVPH